MMNKFEVKNMDLYYGSFHALKNINIAIPEKEITAFIGPSGCGKSTFLKSLNRMNDLVEGCRISGWTVWISIRIRWMSMCCASGLAWCSRSPTPSR